MTPERHREVAERITRSAGKCTRDDWEMKVEAAMLAGTHWVNFALHRRQLTPDSADIVHTSMLVVNDVRRYAAAESDLMDWLAEIEDLRPLYVRGDANGGGEAGDHALALLAKIATRAQLSGTAGPEAR